jgi:hypothetical protein
MALPGAPRVPNPGSAAAGSQLNARNEYPTGSRKEIETCLGHVLVDASIRKLSSDGKTASLANWHVP